MRTPTAEPTTLEDRPLPVRTKLAAAWASFMFLCIYVDYLALYKPGFVDDIRAGVVHEFDTGPTFVALSLTLMAFPSLMIVLSATLPARAARVVNLVVATLFVPPHRLQRRGGVLELLLLLRPLDRARGAAARLRPALRLDLAPDVLNGGTGRRRPRPVPGAGVSRRHGPGVMQRPAP